MRIATHPDFKKFVTGANVRLRGKTHDGVDLEGRLEFFDVGGDPKELMAYMVKSEPCFISLTNWILSCILCPLLLCIKQSARRKWGSCS